MVEVNSMQQEAQRAIYDPESKLEIYRAERFEALGLTRKHAEDFAAYHPIRVSDLRKLVGNGCSPYLAYKILKPLEWN